MIHWSVMFVMSCVCPRLLLTTFTTFTLSGFCDIQSSGVETIGLPPHLGFLSTPCTDAFRGQPNCSASSSLSHVWSLSFKFFSWFATYLDSAGACFRVIRLSVCYTKGIFSLIFWYLGFFCAADFSKSFYSTNFFHSHVTNPFLRHTT